MRSEIRGEQVTLPSEIWERGTVELASQEVPADSGLVIAPLFLKAEMASAPRLLCGFLPCPRDEAAGDEDRRDARRGMRIVAHENGVVDRRAGELGDVGRGIASAKDTDGNHTRGHGEHTRATRF